MSKISMPRTRYIAFKIDSASTVSRRAIGNALRARARHEGWSDADAPALTRYEFPHGIVRVEHTHQDRARALLPAITWVAEGESKLTVTIATIAASGTLAALTAKVGFLQARTA